MLISISQFHLHPAGIQDSTPLFQHSVCVTPPIPKHSKNPGGSIVSRGASEVGRSWIGVFPILVSQPVWRPSATVRLWNGSNLSDLSCSFSQFDDKASFHDLFEVSKSWESTACRFARQCSNLLDTGGCCVRPHSFKFSSSTLATIF